MPKLVFYRQERVDGGVRTGVDRNGECILHRFDPGADEDPVLLWYVDLRFEAKAVPNDAQDVRRWLHSNKAWIVKAIQASADDLVVGFDPDALPYERRSSESPPGMKMSVAVSATRRVPGRKLAAQLKNLAKRWDELVDCLEHEDVTS
jgi:hypothetical protein